MKNLSKLGKTLNKNEQKLISGGFGSSSSGICFNFYGCVDPICGEGSPCEIESPGAPRIGTIVNNQCCFF